LKYSFIYFLLFGNRECLHFYSKFTKVGRCDEIKEVLQIEIPKLGSVSSSKTHLSCLNFTIGTL